VAALVGLATFQVAEHRVRFQRNGATECLDGRERVVARQRRLAPVDEQQELPFAPGGGQLVGGRHAQHHQEEGQKCSFQRGLS
jgi:hypothetical protein